MLTRGRAARAVRPEAAHAALPPLPLPCFLDVLSRLAPGEHLLASAVSRGWRAAVRQPSLCASVDLTREAASPHRASDALLAAVVRAAAGQVTRLCLTLDENGEKASWAAVLAAATACCSNLRHLDLRSPPFHAAADDDNWTPLTMDGIAAATRTARGLLSFHRDVVCTFQDTRELLVNQVVHLRRLVVRDCSSFEASLLARDIRLHPSIQELGCCCRRSCGRGHLA